MFRLVLTSLLLLSSGSLLHAQDEDIGDPAALMLRVERQSKSADESVSLAMRLIDENGKINDRSATFYRRLKSPGSLEDMRLVRFHAPPELAGSGVLTLENTDRPDDQWLYLPAYHTSRKIPSSNRSDRYMGTDFFYEDAGDDKIALYTYRVTGWETIGGRRCVLIEQLPAAEEVKNNSAYGRKMEWVDPERLVIPRIDYFDKNNVLYKRLENSGARQYGPSWRWSEATMTDFRLHHKTVVTYSDRKIDQGVDAGLFTIRKLERGE
jgi:outer membrane lipoprotein-sorting protein